MIRQPSSRSEPKTSSEGCGGRMRQPTAAWEDEAGRDASEPRRQTSTAVPRRLAAARVYNMTYS